MAVTVVRYSEQPELWDSIEDLSSQVWPEYNMHGDVVNPHWGRLYDDLAQWQFVLFDSDEKLVLGEGNTIPVSWDGTDAGLGPGIDAAITGGFEALDAGAAPTALCALSAKIPPELRRRGLSEQILRAMAGLAREAGLANLIAPIRPNLKDRYPTIPIDRYARWTRDDGTPFDPWLRVHVDLGARIGPPIPESMRITGSVADWESWTKMRFPETGDYVFPEGLAPVHIDRERDTGEYWEPSIWLIHPVS
ncbi:MAG TPA: hypothetical protein VFI65_18140 [Streptosporangiaceae bacterium]|nr:hypothetical protein [Streptosporangiaceae bacterium]